ncbi:MAG TPA: DUF805 domain-containing protein [Rhizomicrobium sp.]|nr:DUF805 domain-containing protein [Rhizomicrobium sp.]
MGLLHYLFGFSGRINRAKQWAVLLVALVHVIIIGLIFAFTVGFSVFLDLAQKKTTLAAVLASPQVHTFEIAFCVLYAIGFYIGLAVATKRLHDRNKSAWWLLVFIALPIVLNIPALLYIPHQMDYIAAVIRAAQENLPPPQRPFDPPLVVISRGAATIISLWAFVELYILRGTVGDNRFGPDPLAGRA